ncbi:uncharacterized protein F54H12.2-like [Xenia sp. Carnegie-2017]|uniref:uncharacterized protein F54H12.2-like n=1 Tax=Xenia sp. Carnegie-2017 TaxID=2897299 RepID=UPI001F041166|nr:uncharacterized protein F54H12.2-like [Xenia sp. Carnegie-2017]
MEVADPANASPNKGLKTRSKFTARSAVVEMGGPIFCDVFFGERLLLSYVDLKVVVNRTRDDCTEKSPAVYPVRRVDCKSFIIPSGNPSLQKDNLFNGFVPKSLVVGLVASAAFNGAYKLNPFNFQHFNVSSLGISVNGESLPSKPFKLSFGNNPRYIELNAGNGIDRDEFLKGFALYCFDLTPDMCGTGEHFNTVQKGNLAIDIQFSTAPTNAVSLVCYGEFENVIFIDSKRNVVYDYIG